MPSNVARARPRIRPRTAATGPRAVPVRRRGAIRWDRVGRLALLVVLGAILLLYIAPVRHWIAQSRTADAHREELREVERENRELRRRARALQDPGSLEREARRLGMVREGEKAYVVSLNPRPRRSGGSRSARPRP